MSFFDIKLKNTLLIQVLLKLYKQWLQLENVDLICVILTCMNIHLLVTKHAHNEKTT